MTAWAARSSLLASSASSASFCGLEAVDDAEEEESAAGGGQWWSSAATASAASTVCSASPIRSFPCSPRTTYPASRLPAAERSFLMSPRLRSLDPEPEEAAMSLKAEYTEATVSGFGLNMTFCAARASAATTPRSPRLSRSSLTLASERPVASASARIRVASPTPSSTPACAGATRLTQR